MEAKSLGELTTKVADGLDMGEAVSVCPVAPNIGSAVVFGSLSEIKDKVRSYRDRKCLQHFCDWVKQNAAVVTGEGLCVANEDVRPTFCSENQRDCCRCAGPSPSPGPTGSKPRA